MSLILKVCNENLSDTLSSRFFGDNEFRILLRGVLTNIILVVDFSSRNNTFLNPFVGSSFKTVKVNF